MNPNNINNNQLIEKLKEDDNKSNFKKNDVLKEMMLKRLFKLAIFTVIFVIIIFILSLFITGRKTYEEVEVIMKKAAVKYYQENNNNLPKVTGNTVEVSAKKLSNLKYMRDISKYIKKDSCTGKVVVENNDDSYIYIPYLDCGENYKTTELFREITNNKNIVTSGSGLYSNNGEYIFKGDNTNNYLSINNKLWRIVKINANNEIGLILQDSTSYSSYPWDNRYNIDKKYNVGINDFAVSRIKDSLDKLYEREDDKALFTKQDKEYLVFHNYCISKKDKNDNTIDSDSSCSEFSDKMKVGLLTVSEFMNASLDASCVNPVSKSCQNYNYLVNKDISWWLITASSSSSYEAYSVSTGGVIETTNTSIYKKLRPVIYLNSKTMYKSGDGSKENPYLIK